MWVFVGLIIGFICLLLAVIALARSGGSKAAKLEALNAEARQKRFYNEQMDNVRNMPATDVRERLQNRTDN